MLIVVYGKMFAPILRQFGLSLAISGVCYPLKIAKNRHLDVICDVIAPDDVIFLFENAFIVLLVQFPMG